MGLMAVVGGLAIVVAAVGAAQHAANAAAGRTQELSFWLLVLTLALGYGILTMVLRATDAVALRRVAGAIALCEGIALLTAEWASLGEGVALHTWALWLGSWLWAPGYVAVGAALPLLLPDGKLPSHRWRPALWLSLTAVVTSALGWALTPYDAQDFPETRMGMTNPVGLAVMDHPAVAPTWSALGVCAVLVALASLVVRWRAAADVERQQLKWVVLGMAATLLLAAVAITQLLTPQATQVVSALAMLPLPLAVAVAVLRHRLWNVDLVISRSLVVTVLSALVLAVYLLVVWSLGDLLGARTGAPLLATAVVALLVLPLHSRLQRWVNRWVHGADDEPYAVLARLGDRLASAQTPDDLAGVVLPSVAEQVTRTLRAGGARLTLTDGSTAVFGTTSGTQTRLPLEYGGEQVGELSVWRSGGLGWGDRQALDRLARQTAVSAHTVLLARDIKAARETVLRAREEERRRLRRDLHDGVGPSLAALALQMETARDLVTDDPAGSRELLDRLVPRLNATVADVRALVHELRPPTLDELGLGTAVRELGARLSTSSTAVATRCEDLGTLPAATEVAAYRIAGEAVANAVRHADASLVEVLLRRDDGVLRLEVADDGRGLPPGPRDGVGLPSMRLRAEELGGVLDTVSGPAGTRITALLPIGATG